MTDADFKWHYKEIARHRNEAIEKCARVAEEHDVGQGWGDAIAAAIRALKNKP